jgi:tRNA-specific 2-thiouridylase
LTIFPAPAWVSTVPDREKILVAMSGGVDSSVAALLLKQQGHDIVGAYMKNWINEDNVIGECPWMQDIEDARAVAERIGIEFRVVNLMQDYRRLVVDYLLEGYQHGLTPNPDVMCNREMKFGVFAQYARAEGFIGLATGHYARRVEVPGGFALLEGVDRNKDQSYFLALLSAEQLRFARFPIGHLTKPELRGLAADARLPNAAKKDSQGICFIGEVKMEDFLRTFVDDQPGPIVNLEGKVVGDHRGLHLYTLGQRKGLGVASPLYKQAYVVVAKRQSTRELVIAIEQADTPLLWSRKAVLTSLSTVGPDLTRERTLQAQPRYRCHAGDATFKPFLREDGWAAELEYREPQRALTPGQICALYDGERLLGGAVFESIEHGP